MNKDGNPIPRADWGSATFTNPTSSVVLPQGTPLGGLPAAGNDSSRFIMAVMNRVPEIGPALAVILPEDHIASFPYVVDAAKTVLRALQEQFARSTDDVSCDLYRRITSCIALIESSCADLDLAAPVSGGGGVPGSAHSTPPFTTPAMRHAQLFGMGINPNALPSPGAPRLDLAGMGFVAAGGGIGMVSYPISEEQLAIAHHFQNQQTTRTISDQSGSFHPLKENNAMPRHDVAKSESPIDDNMPMMAMYKSEKKAAMRARKAEKRKRTPKLVHKVKAPPPLKTADPTRKTSLVQKMVQHALFRGGFAESKESPKRIIRAESDPSEDVPLDTLSASPEKIDGPSNKSNNPTELTSKSAEDDLESKHAKKRCVANQTNSNVVNNKDNNDSTTIDRENRKTDIHCGPHCEVLEKLFADDVKQSSDNGDATEAESERSADDETEEEIVSLGGSPKSKEAIDKPVKPSSRDAVSTPEDDAVSVLMGLMCK